MTFSKRKEVAILTSGKGSGAKGRGTSGLRKVAFEELNVTVGAAVWFLELRTER